MSAFVKNPNNETTCLGSYSTFMCETNDTSNPINWLIRIQNVYMTVDGSSKMNSTLVLLATRQLHGASVQCYYSYPGAILFSSPAFISVQGLCNVPEND